jgi:DNA-binding GntR family transcriptional regulator
VTTDLTRTQVDRPDSLSNVVYDAIRSSIIDRTLAPGTRVSEAKLAESLGVSKTPVREALLRLAQVGLIDPDGVRGGRIPKPSVERLRGAYELREAIEAQTAFLAASNAAPEDIAAAEAAADACLERAQANDIQGFREYDRAFHKAVAAATYNVYLQRSLLDAYDLAWTLRLRDSGPSDASVECAEDHQLVIRAIAEGAGLTARDLMTKHVRRVRDLVVGRATS